MPTTRALAICLEPLGDALFVESVATGQLCRGLLLGEALEADVALAVLGRVGGRKLRDKLGTRRFLLTFRLSIGLGSEKLSEKHRTGLPWKGGRRSGRLGVSDKAERHLERHIPGMREQALKRRASSGWNLPLSGVFLLPLA